MGSDFGQMPWLSRSRSCYFSSQWLALVVCLETGMHAIYVNMRLIDCIMLRTGKTTNATPPCNNTRHFFCAEAMCFFCILVVDNVGYRWRQGQKVRPNHCARDTGHSWCAECSACAEESGPGPTRNTRRKQITPNSASTWWEVVHLVLCDLFVRLIYSFIYLFIYFLSSGGFFSVQLLY